MFKMALAVESYSIARTCNSNKFVAVHNNNNNNNTLVISGRLLDENDGISEDERWSGNDAESFEDSDHFIALRKPSDFNEKPACNGDVTVVESPAVITDRNENGADLAVCTDNFGDSDRPVVKVVENKQPSCPDDGGNAAHSDLSSSVDAFPITSPSADSGATIIQNEKRHEIDAGKSPLDRMAVDATDIEPLCCSESLTTHCITEIISETPNRLKPVIAYRKQRSEKDCDATRIVRCRQKLRRDRRTASSKRREPCEDASNISGQEKKRSNCWHVLPIAETGFCLSLLPRRGQPDIAATAEDEPEDDTANDERFREVELSGSELPVTSVPDRELTAEGSTSTDVCSNAQRSVEVVSNSTSSSSAEVRHDANDNNRVSGAFEEDLDGKGSVEFQEACDRFEWINGCMQANGDYSDDDFDDGDCGGKMDGHVTMTQSSSRTRRKTPVGLCPTSDKRLRRKAKWRIEKARVQLKTKHCRTVCNSVHGVSMYVNHRVAKRMSLMEIVEPSSMYRKEISIREIDLNKAKPWPKQTSSSLASKTHLSTTQTTDARPVVRKARSTRPAAVAGAEQWVYAADEGNFDSSLSDELRAVLLALQHRDLDPEDYDLLLRLDERVKPKTVETSVLDSLRVEVVAEPEIFFDAATTAGDDRQLPRISDQPDGIIEADVPLTVCGVCLERYEVGQRRKYLPCGHAFHADCIDSWLGESSLNCPLDGLPIVTL